MNCHQLASVDIPSRVYAIGSSAFVECSQLRAITIPASVRFLGDEAFMKTGITDVYFESASCRCASLPVTNNDSAVITLHFPVYALDEEVWTVDDTISLFDRYTKNFRVVYDVLSDE